MRKFAEGESWPGVDLEVGREWGGWVGGEVVEAGREERVLVLRR